MPFETGQAGRKGARFFLYPKTCTNEKSVLLLCRMNAKHIIDLINAQTGFTPFSNGTEAMCWSDENCDRCVKSYLTRHPNEADTFDLTEAEKAALVGTECAAKYAIDFGWISSVIPPEVSEWMGGTEKRLPRNCIHFSDDERDNPENQPDPVDPRQLKIPFLCVELFGFDNPDILVFDRAIVEREIFETA